MRISMFTLVILVFFAETTYTQDLNKKISSEELLVDFKYLKSNLIKLHAGLYNYHSEQDFEEIFKQYQNKIKDSMSPMEFYRKVGTLVEVIGDAHTEIEPPETFYDALNQEWMVLPVSVVWLNNQLYTIRDFNRDTEIVPGDQILSINGIESGQLFKNLRRYVPRDGRNTTSPNHTLSGLFGQFRNYYAAIYGQPDSYVVEVQDRAGKTRKHSVEGLKYRTIFDTYDAEKSTVKKAEKPKPLAFRIRDSIGILRVSSFHPGKIKDSGQNFKRIFKNCFVQIKKYNVNRLIIDIRGNGGGHEVVFTELFSYLAKKPFRAYKQLHTITNKVPNPEYYLEQEEIEELENWATKNLQAQQDLFLVTDEIGVKQLRPKKPNFNGKVLVLIDGKTSSAAGDFSGLIRSYGEVMFMGEETGGNPYINTAGTRLTLVLPNSGLQIIIPTLLYTINIEGENPGYGMRPEIEVELGIDDFLGKEDVMMQKALSLMKE
ncbi:MAG: S41 family peptidase [Bacteroidota bacterium]